MVHAEALTGPAGVVLDGEAPLGPFREWAAAAKSGGSKVGCRSILDIVRAVRAAVVPSFAVAVKLNSADFQRGGFDADDAAKVIAMLAPLGVDLVELSGGSYEAPAMTGRAGDQRTRAREAYFLTLAKELARTGPLPLMLTGGIVRRPVAEEVLAGGIDLVGMGTALAVEPDLPTKWRNGDDTAVELAPVAIKDKALASAAGMARVRVQLRRLGNGQPNCPTVNPTLAYVREAIRQRRALRRYRRWLGRRGTLRSVEPLSVGRPCHLAR